MGKLKLDTKKPHRKGVQSRVFHGNHIPFTKLVEGRDFQAGTMGLHFLPKDLDPKTYR